MSVYTMLLAVTGAYTMTVLSGEIHKSNVDAGWWTDKDTGETLLGRDDRGRWRRNNGELMMLSVSELSEASEGAAGMLKDDKLPHRDMFEVELADTAIRLLDLGGARGVDFTAIFGQLDAFEEFAEINGCMTEDEALMVVVNCISEAMEGDRKGIGSKRAPTFSQFHAGLARALAAVFTIGQEFGHDVMGALEEKWAYNKTREDHKLENRQKPGGKAY